MVGSHHIHYSLALAARPVLHRVLACVLIVMTPAVYGDDTGRSDEFEASVATVVARVMTYRHYSQHPLDDTISERLFDGYLATLDPERLYFLQSDVDALSPHRRLLDNALNRGDLSFAFVAYERFLRRVEERVAYAQKRLQQPFYFTNEENIETDRTSAHWCHTPSTLNTLWQRHLGNACLERQLRYERWNPAHTAAASATDQTQAASEVRRLHQQFLRQWQQKSRLQIIELYLKAFTAAYDPHSVYMAPANHENLNIALQLSLEGIGAHLKRYDDTITVVGLVPGGPADIDGRLQAGDRILRIGQETGEDVSAIGMSLAQAARLIRGTRGSRVHLTVLGPKEDGDDTPMLITILRDKVQLRGGHARELLRPLPPSELERPPPQTEPTLSPSTTNDPTHLRPSPTDVAVTDDDMPTTTPDLENILVIRVPTFYADKEYTGAIPVPGRSSTGDVLHALQRKRPEHLAGVILDLRDNQGGPLREATAIAGVFLDGGPILQTRSALIAPQVLVDRDETIHYQGPLIVLVNHVSASAAEIVAAALQDRQRAIVVGERRTYGKGTVQTVLDLTTFTPTNLLATGREPGGIRFTSSKFYRITGDSTQQRGVIPDLIFRSLADYRKTGERHLPNALPFDKLEAVAFDTGNTVRQYVPILRERLNARLKTDADYQRRVRVLDAWGEHERISHLPLAPEQRRAHLEREYHVARQLRELEVNDSRFGRSDFLLNQTMQIMADFVKIANETPILNAPWRHDALNELAK